MRRCYFSKSYKDLQSAGNKAKTDIEYIMSQHGFVNLGLRQVEQKGSASRFIYTLASVLKTIVKLRKGDMLVVQYPFKKYFDTICRMAHLRGSKVITVIHDLGSFRRKKLTVEQEIKRLNRSDVIIAHNDKMKQWLVDNGCTRPVNSLEIFDFVSQSTAPAEVESVGRPAVAYAGSLNRKKTGFLYRIEPHMSGYTLSLYGGGFETGEVNDSAKFKYNGFAHFEDLIAQPHGHFGLVWEGESADTCSGTPGEYLRYNNPHKTSLYLRCHLPLIIWEEAALADFVHQNEIGIKVKSLEDLNEALASVSAEAYERMKQNAIAMSRKLVSGYFFMKAFGEAEELLRKGCDND